MTIFAHGEYPVMYPVIGYVFFLPILTGLIESYLINTKSGNQKIKERTMLKIIVINYFVTILGSFIIGYFVSIFKIDNLKTEFLALMIALTAVQVVSKTLLFKWLKFVEKSFGFRLSKLLSFETVIINSFFYVIVILI
jgi:hypothetical protein